MMETTSKSKPKPKPKPKPGGRIKPKPCHNLDCLAERILSSCCICDHLTETHLDFHEELEHPYIFALERVLGIRNDQGVGAPIKISSDTTGSNVSGNGDGNGTSALLTCTDASPLFRQNNDNGPLDGVSVSVPVETSQLELPKFWSPPMPNANADAIESATSSSSISWPMLEDAAPFSKDFYIHVGELIVYALSPNTCTFTSATTTTIATAKEKVGEDGSGSTSGNANAREDYSLFQERMEVRIIRILSALMKIDVIGEDEIGYTIKNKASTTHVDCMEQDDHVTFLDLLLHYTEGSTHVVINRDGSSQMETEMKAKNVNTTTITPTSAASRRVPILHAIFKHFGNLPQLESHVHTKTRLFRNSFTALSTDNHHKNSSTSLKIDHVKKAEVYQERLQREFKRHVDALEMTAGAMYDRCDSTLRKKSRLKIGNLLHNFVMTHGSSKGGGGGSAGSGGGGGYFGVENTCAAGIDPLLQILLRILRGSALALEKDDDHFALSDPYRHLLSSVLLPLHKPSGMVLWRDQTPLLGLYHKTLVVCIGTIVGSEKDMIGSVIKYVIHPDVWPLEGKAGDGKARSSANTPKLVLLLHEIDTLIGLLDIDEDKGVGPNFMSESVIPLVLRICSCISSDNSRSSERALEFFKNKKFKCLVRSNLSKIMTPLLRALCRIDSEMEVPWNPTVRKMSSVVLEELESYDENLFETSCRELFVPYHTTTKTESVMEDDGSSPKTKSSIILSHNESPSSEMFSLKSSMGGWRPPSNKKSTFRKEGSRVPGISSTMPPPMSRNNNGRQGKVQPPLTVTGIAPWAVNKRVGTAPMNGIVGRRNTTKTPRLIPSQAKHVPSSDVDCQDDTLGKTKADNRNQIDALTKVRAYMKSLKPTSDCTEESDDGVSSWAKAQMSESPVLLPNLKFHDLVFGQVLGTGAFSTVKYARRITKGKTRSHWPEYAVKIVSTQKIEELGYEKSVNREIAILQTMSHPGISRLISSFRFRDGAYMILEYASGGDLHTLLKRNGSLDEESTRFVTGELVAALDYIHSLDFVYGDLKPENILITEVGHIKLTDFGGCRPLTGAAKTIVRNAGKNVIRNLRDGDWRISKTETSENVSEEDQKEGNNDEDDEDDLRVEGTTAYLPPEVVLGGIPSKASDSWSLGCCVFQCLSGRPPLLDATDFSTRQKIVSFQLQSDDDSDAESEFFLERTGSRSFSQDSKTLIKCLLAKDPTERPTMTAVADFDFFSGVDLLSLHRRPPHPLDSGNIGPSPDAQWSRRQFSSIWAPQPQEYIISDSKAATNMSFDRLHTPIMEGGEREGYFLSNAAGNKTVLVGIIER